VEPTHPPQAQDSAAPDGIATTLRARRVAELADSVADYPARTRHLALRLAHQLTAGQVDELHCLLCEVETHHTDTTVAEMDLFGYRLFAHLGLPRELYHVLDAHVREADSDCAVCEANPVTPAAAVSA
jgi:hypothetical protein